LSKRKTDTRSVKQTAVSMEMRPMGRKKKDDLLRCPGGEERKEGKREKNSMVRVLAHWGGKRAGGGGEKGFRMQKKMGKVNLRGCDERDGGGRTSSAGKNFPGEKKP